MHPNTSTASGWCSPICWGSEKFNLRYKDPAQLAAIADKLRWYRYRKGLRQRDMADFVGIDRSTYIHNEEPGREYYPLDKLEKIAELLSVLTVELLVNAEMI